MTTELRCPECGSICADVKVQENGWRSGVCRNPACRLNKDGVGLITQARGVVAVMSFPTSGTRLEDLMAMVHGKAPSDSLPEDVGVLDGFTFCGECGAPMFSDGKEHYRHIQGLPRDRVCKLMKVRKFAEQVYSWLVTVDFTGHKHGRQPNPFIWELDRETFCGYVATRAGVKDLLSVLRRLG